MTKAEIIIAALTTAGASFTLVGAAFYKVTRILKEDRANDGLHKNAIDIIEVHRKNATDAWELNGKLQERLEVVEKERNAFATEVGELRATVEYMTERIEELSVTCLKLKEENEQLSDSIQQQKDLLEGMFKLQNALLVKMGGME